MVSQVSYVSNDERLPDIFKASGLKATKLSEAEARTLGKTADAPAVLVLDVRPHHQLAPWVNEVQKKQPGLAIVVIVSTLDARFILEAMRAGIKECLPEPITPQALDEARRSSGGVRGRQGRRRHDDPGGEHSRGAGQNGRLAAAAHRSARRAR